MSVFNVANYGAVGDDVTDDTLAIQAAIDASIANDCGTVYFPCPSVAYKISPQIAGGNDALIISNPQSIKFVGDGVGKSIIKFYTLGGLDPATNWEIVDTKLWRGSMFGVKTDLVPTAQAPLVLFQDLELDGNIVPGNQNILTFPADPITGDGYDITNNGIILEGYFGNVVFERIHIHNVRGECSYSGGTEFELFTARDSEFDDTNGHGTNLSSAKHAYIEDCFYHNLGNDALETVLRGGMSFVSNRVEFTKTGVYTGQFDAFAGATDQTITIANNHFRGCVESGITYFGTKAMIHDNMIIDCGTTGPGAIVLSPAVGGGWPAIRDGIEVRNNSILAYDASEVIGNGIQIQDQVGGVLRNYTVKNNTIEAINGGRIDVALRLSIQGDGTNGLIAQNVIKNVDRYMESAATLVQMPLCRGDVTSSFSGVTNLTQQQIATGDTLVVLGPQVQIFGTSTPGLTPTVDASIYSQGHVSIIQGFPTNPIFIAQNAPGFKLKADRTMDTLNKYLFVEFIGGVFAETNFLDLS